MATPISRFTGQTWTCRLFFFFCIIVVISWQLKYLRKITDDISDDAFGFHPKHDHALNKNDSASLMSSINTVDYMKNRTTKFYSWFEGNRSDKLLPDADANGTIMDFMIAGFPKCGTTTVEANLGYLAPMPVADVCTPVHQTVYYSYQNWPRAYGKEKLYRGTKCPAFIQNKFLEDWSKYLPKTKIIVGIRHPVKWFQSFWNMQAGNGLLGDDTPYDRMKPCNKGCSNSCPPGQLFCVNRARFHKALASLGKTLLSEEERSLLGLIHSDQGAEVITNYHIRNPIFLYEQTMLGGEDVWEDLRKYLGIEHSLKHDKLITAGGRSRKLSINLCNETYDNFRAYMMPISYNISVWLQKYFIPVAKTRKDVTIANSETFAKIVETYKIDPCGKLRRLDNGNYILQSLNVTEK